MKKNINSITAKLILAIILWTTACASLGGFTRGTATEAIEQDPRYKAPATMTIDIGWRLTNAQAKAWQISQDDTAEAAAIRAKADFMLRHPQIILAEHLGYIKFHLEKPELGASSMNMPSELYRQRLGVWHFRPRAEITDKGRELWRNLKLQENNEWLPLAVRQSPEITGITDENQNSKRADFTYKWKPTELGEAFDPNSKSFTELPPNLQDALKKTQRNIFGGGNNNLADYNTLRKGLARFRKFDDGWRLSDLMFY